MNTWWQNLNSRERRLVVLAGSLLAIALLWVLVGKPLASRYKLLQQDVQTALELNQQMQQQRGEIEQLRGAASTTPNLSDENLYSAVNKLLKQHQLDGEGTSADEKDNNQVSLKLDGKPFDTLIRFLAQLENEYAAHTTSMTLKPTDKSGMVDAEILLQR